jgi:hypothetical protein
MKGYSKKTAMKRLPPIRRGEIIGRPTGWVRESEADHFMQCPGCGAWIDMRDLGITLGHAGPFPHPAVDQPQ